MAFIPDDALAQKDAEVMLLRQTASDLESRLTYQQCRVIREVADWGAQG
jgi:hypothetical protein